jgi:metal-responsive CopG/Arc/MetJ family transcriptional regulator
MPTKGMMRLVPISMTDAQIAYLDERAGQEKSSRAKVVRDMIDQERDGGVPA